MKLTTLMCFVFSFFIISNLSAQDHQVGRAPKQVSDNQKTNTVITPTDNASAFNSRFFGINITGDQVVKGFLNTPGTLTNMAATTRNLYAGAWANGKWYVIDYVAATTSSLGTLDTVTGVFTSIGTITGLTGTVTGMSYDKTTSTMYVAAITTTAPPAGNLYTINLTTAALTLAAPLTSVPIDMSFNNTGVLYAADLVTDNLFTINKTTGAGTVVGPLGINLNYAQGMCFDPQTDSLFLAAYLLGGTTGSIYRASTTTGTATLIGAFPPSTEMDAFIIPGSTPPPPAGNTLVLLNDSTLAPTLNARRTADRDTLRKYLPMLLGNFTYYYKDTTAADVPTNLNNYSTIIVQETAYDYVSAAAAGGSFVMTGAWRNALKNWLNGGTPTAKRTLMFIGGDWGYAYDRTASTSYDTSFSRGIGGSQYVSDDAGPTGFNGTYLIPNTTNIDNLNTATTGYYPDGCKPVSGGVAFTRYMNRPTTDSSAGITKTTANWNFVGIFQDPRYYTGTGGNPNPDQGFKRALSQVLAWAKANGSNLTTVEPVGSQLVSDYKLSQNYPNPFNPATKINFSIPKSGLTTLKVYDILGKEVATLVNQTMTAGSYVVDFNASQLSSGAYFYRLEVNGFVATKKMLLIK